MPKRSHVTIGLLSSAIYVLLILIHGYYYGHRDLMEIGPYLKFLSDKSLYPNDYYIQSITSHFPDARLAFVLLLKTLGITGPWSTWILHFLATITLTTGMLGIARLFTRDYLFASLAVLGTNLLMYHYNIGGNELYYNNLNSSMLSKSIGIWGIYFLLKPKYNTSLVIITISTIIHAIAGLQLFLIISGIIGTRLILSSKKTKATKLIPGFLFFILIAGSWIFLLMNQFGDSALDQTTVFNFFYHRLGHHYNPNLFGWTNVLLIGPVLLAGWYYYYRNKATEEMYQSTFLFFTICFLGMTIYSVAAVQLHSLTVIKAQWFKTTIWLKFFGNIAVFLIIKNWLLPKLPRWVTVRSVPLTIGVFVILGLFLAYKFPKRHPETGDFPWRGAYNDAIKIAELAKTITPKDALFATPKDFTHLKHYGERSSYIDFKTSVHNSEEITEWYSRVHQVYGPIPDDYYRQRIKKPLRLPIDVAGLEKLKKLGITHLITDGAISERADMLGKFGGYYLYKLE